MECVHDRPRLLVLLNPGAVSRWYMLGIGRAAERLGIFAGSIELGEVWQKLGKGGEASRRAIAEEVRAHCRRERVTHAIGYVHNGVFEFGVEEDSRFGEAGLLAAMGVRHICLWTDHPHWAVNGSALEPVPRRVLGHPMYRHVVKSESAAAELREMAGWADVVSMAMAEDAELLRPAAGALETHDVVAILSDACAPPEALADMLAREDPDPLEMMERMAPAARLACETALSGMGMSGELSARAEEFVREWMQAKLASPHDSLWRGAGRLESRHGEVLGWLRADIRRWRGATAGLGALTAWRRSFWLAWLARRVDVGVYGSDARGITPNQAESARARVAYRDQPAVYARGRVALNINAAHDEEGLTHKPFQIAASGVACVHHATRGLGECFERGREMMAFERGPELLEAVRQLSSDAGARRAMAEAARGRLERDHTWEMRLEALLRVSGAAEVHRLSV